MSGQYILFARHSSPCAGHALEVLKGVHCSPVRDAEVLEPESAILCRGMRWDAVGCGGITFYHPTDGKSLTKKPWDAVGCGGMRWEQWDAVGCGGITFNHLRVAKA